MPSAGARARADRESEVVGRARRLLTEHPPPTTSRAEFLGAQFDAGLAWVHFPVGYGGLDYPVQLQEVIRRVLEAGSAPSGQAMNTTGYGQGSATIVAEGTEDQKRRYLRPLFACEEIWCQLFGEPGSGSDPRGSVDPSGSRRGRLDGHRPEGMDDPWAPRASGLADDIQRNIIAERVLGLPRDIAVDRGVPWNQVVRN